MIVGPALKGREYRPIDALGELLAAHDHRPARPAQRLVGSGGDDVGVRGGVLVNAGDDEPGDVGDVGEEIGAHLLGDLAEGAEVELSGVGGGPGDDYLGPLLLRHLADGVIVDTLGLPIHGVANGTVEPRREAHVPAVGQMAAVGQAEAHDRVAGLE